MSTTTRPPARPEPMLTVDDLAELLRLAPRTVWRMIGTGQLPPPDLRIGKRVVRWRRDGIDNWIAAQAAA